MSEPGHWCGGFDIRPGLAANSYGECQIQETHQKTYTCQCPFGSDIRKQAPATRYECQNRDTGAVDLTFAPVLPRTLMANVKSKKRTRKLSLASVPLVLTFVNKPPQHDTNVRTGTLVRWI